MPNFAKMPDPKMKLLAQALKRRKQETGAANLPMMKQEKM